jgi:hypothetical protein
LAGENLKKKLVTCLTIIALLFITISCSPASSIVLPPSIPLGSTTGTVETSYSYNTKATAPYSGWAKYTFDWGDSTNQSTTALVKYGTTASASHIWSTAGTYQVKAMITIKSGNTSDFSNPLSVTITGPAPVNNPPAAPSIPSGSTAGSSGTSYSYSTKATDPDGDQVKYTFDWGDGTTSITSLVSSGTAASASHSWNAAGTYSVKVMATDSKGAISTWSGSLAVSVTGSDANRAPYAPFAPWGTGTTYANQLCSYSAEATDPDGDQVRYTFDWGDGTSSTTSMVNSGTTASASHKWSVPPNTITTFNVRATATDEHGSTSGWSSIIAVRVHGPVVNYPPTIASKPSGPTSGVSGTSYSYSTKATDPDDGDQIQYIFAWGDETTTTGFFASGVTATASHSWYVPPGLTGIFNVHVMAVDWHGLCSPDPIWSESLRVTITGSSVQSFQATELQAESDQIIDVQTEADKAINAQDETVETIIMLTEPDNTTDTHTEDQALDTQTEDEALDSQTEDEALDSQTEYEALDTQTGEDCPVAEDDEYLLVSVGGVLEISAPGLLDNDQYGKDNSLSVMSYTQPTHAANFVLNTDGSFTYTRSQDYCGKDSFIYMATDGYCESNEATVTIYADCERQNEDEEVIEPQVKEHKSWSLSLLTKLESRPK